ncbi:tRNA lysidine(34) synthetase TilS [Spiroplasma turonicum]|nr:tRNA lysidine(34) synthetase TilS [Spiroplasma turonicum]ALX70280.1 tRNA(Ile)-lysidine synthase [Spiroplasma turonicum]
MKLKKNKKYIVAVSGGPDSMYLLHNLVKKNFKNLVVCHVNHNYRVDSIHDQLLVEDYCKKNNILFYVKNIYYETKNKNFESWARNERYSFLKEILIKEEADAILTGHNKNDHIETYLLQTQKNKMVKFYGIKNKTHINNCLILRPILNLKKSTIIKKMNKFNLLYAIDTTNYDTKYSRNKIRKNLSESSFKYYEKLIYIENKEVDKYNKTILKLLPKQKKYFDLNTFTKDNDFNLRYFFKYVEENYRVTEILKSKKARLKEIIRQLSSDKSYINISINSFNIIKDYNRVYIVKNSTVEVFESFSKPQGFEWTQNEKTNLIYTNNWVKWQSKLYYNKKRLKDFYMNKKFSYLKRFKTILVFDPVDKVILNKIC